MKDDLGLPVNAQPPFQPFRHQHRQVAQNTSRLVVDWAGSVVRNHHYQLHGSHVFVGG